MAHSVRRVVSSIVAGSALFAGLIFPTQAGAQTSQSNVEEIATTVDKASTGRPGSDTEVASTKIGSNFEAKLDDATIKIPQNASEGVVATKSSGASESVTIGIGDGKQQEGQLAADGSVVYSGDNVGKTVQAAEDGVRISTVIKSTEAATEYIHQLKLPEGAKVMRASEYQLSAEDAKDAKAAAEAATTNTNASADPIIIVDKDNKFIGGFAEAWAKDANGKEVSTNYEIRDGALVQKVDHKQQGVQYPVVADPFLFLDLIESAEWIKGDSGWTLSVAPTSWARWNLGYSVGVFGWDELYDKYKDEGRGIKTNIGGLRDQYICHHAWAPLKERWNLDEWRPDVTYWETVLAKCNP